MPSPTMPGRHAAWYFPAGSSTSRVRATPGAMFSTSPTIRSPEPRISNSVTFEPLFVTVNRWVPAGSCFTSTVHAVSVAPTAMSSEALDAVVVEPVEPPQPASARTATVAPARAVDCLRTGGGLLGSHGAAGREEAGVAHDVRLRCGLPGEPAGQQEQRQHGDQVEAVGHHLQHGRLS